SNIGFWMMPPTCSSSARTGSRPDFTIAGAMRKSYTESKSIALPAASTFRPKGINTKQSGSIVRVSSSLGPESNAGRAGLRELRSQLTPEQPVVEQRLHHERVRDDTRMVAAERVFREAL